MKTVWTDYVELRAALDAYDDDPASAYARDCFYGNVDTDIIRALLAERDALREALEAAMECGMVPSSSAKDGGASRYVRQIQVADMIRAALAHGEV